MAVAEMSDALEAEFEEPVVPSELDQQTHAEMLHLYEESANSIRFAKSQQWKTLGATIVLFAGFIALAMFAREDTVLVKLITFVSFLVGGSALYTLVLLQVWQNTEREKLRHISSRLSNVARTIRAIKSRREANFHRYTILFFMAAMIILGNVLIVMVLRPLYS